MSTPFRQHRDVLSKSPATAHGLVGRSPASAEEGGLLFGDFLLATQEKATRAPQAHESPCFKVALKWAGWLSRSGCFRPGPVVQRSSSADGNAHSGMAAG